VFLTFPSSKVNFLNNMRRQGIDGGGVFKEFLTELCKEVFNSDRGLWLENKKNELYPNPHTYATECTYSLRHPYNSS